MRLLVVRHTDFNGSGAVMPAQAGIQAKQDRERRQSPPRPSLSLSLSRLSVSLPCWIPAFAGMTRPLFIHHLHCGGLLGFVLPRYSHRLAMYLVWLSVFCLPSGAGAIMPPQVYQEARDTAMFHVQVKITGVKEPERTPGECTVTGEVVRIFRDKPGTLRQGARLDFTVSCTKPGDPVAIGGTIWTDYERLLKAKYLEVFLNRTDQGYEVALWQSQIIEEPTAQPTFPPSDATGK
jgi:hypothetical protein